MASIYGTTGNDVLLGSATNDFISSFEGNDTIDAAEGDDILRGGSGADWLNGGDGFDRADYRDSDAGIEIAYSPLGFATGTGGTAEGDYLTNIEAIIGSSHNDKVVGWLGGDTYFHIAGNDQYFSSDSKIDFEMASAAANGTGVVVNLQQIDAIAVMSTFTQTDVTVLGVLNGNFIDQAIASGGSSVEMIGVVDVDGTQNADWIHGDEYNNAIDGHGGNDFLYGNRGSDRIYGGSGDDFIEAGYGDDWISGDNDTVYGEGGNDTIFGGMDDDQLRGDNGDDDLNGDAGNDTLRGGEGNDLLDGGIGVDRIYGDAGQDTLNGGTDSSIDYLVGGAGADTFQFSNVSGRDRILDFEIGSDSIDLSQISNLASFADVIANAYDLSNGHLRINFGGGDLVYVYNTTLAELSSEDFIF